MALSLITPATSAPVSVASAKVYCGMDAGDTTFDELLGILVPAAVEQVETMSGRLMGEQTWQLSLDKFSDAIELGVGPVTAVNAFSYIDPAGDEQTVDLELYSLDLVTNPQRIVLGDGEAWPDVAKMVNAVTIQFVAGYTAGTMPSRLALAALILVAHWFENRGAVNVGNIVTDLPHGLRALTDPFRRVLI